MVAFLATGIVLRCAVQLRRKHVTSFMRTISLLDEALMNVNTGASRILAIPFPLLLAVFNHAYGGCKSPERLRSHSIFLVTLSGCAAWTWIPSPSKQRRHGCSSRAPLTPTPSSTTKTRSTRSPSSSLSFRPFWVADRDFRQGDLATLARPKLVRLYGLWRTQEKSGAREWERERARPTLARCGESLYFVQKYLYISSVSHSYKKCKQTSDFKKCK